MKKINLMAVCTLFFLAAFSQSPNSVVQWSYNAVKKGDKNYEIVLTAKLAAGWHIYSQYMSEGGPVPTKIQFKKNPLVQPIGAIKEIGALQTNYDKNFEMNVKYFSNKVDFVQKASLKSNVKTKLSGEVEYMVCNDEKCLPPAKQTFTLSIQ
jgi:thiol:disulfide interchange protein DsbD